jgi:hypothetical protein
MNHRENAVVFSGFAGQKKLEPSKKVPVAICLFPVCCRSGCGGEKFLP